MLVLGLLFSGLAGELAIAPPCPGRKRPRAAGAKPVKLVVLGDFADRRAMACRASAAFPERSSKKP